MNSQLYQKTPPRLHGDIAQQLRFRLHFEISSVQYEVSPLTATFLLYLKVNSLTIQSSCVGFIGI